MWYCLLWCTKVDLTFKSVVGTLVCDHVAGKFYSTVYYPVQDAFCIIQ